MIARTIVNTFRPGDAAPGRVGVEAHPLVDQRFETQPFDQRANQNQPCVHHPVGSSKSTSIRSMFRETVLTKCLPDLGV